MFFHFLHGRLVLFQQLSETHSAVSVNGWFHVVNLFKVVPVDDNQYSVIIVAMDA